MTTVVTPRGFHLGKLAPKFPAIGTLASYATAGGLPQPPPQAHFGGPVTAQWGMDGNGPDPSVTVMGAGFQGVGDCVPSAAAHFDLMSNYDESASLPAQYGNAVVEDYCSYLGTTPAAMEANSALDTGCVISDYLQSWLTTGQFGYKIGAYASVNHTNITELQQGLAYGGGLIIGVNLPESAEEQFPNEWTVVQNSPILGGHCILLTGYADNRWYGCTWGELIIEGISYPWLSQYCDEAWVVISEQAVTANTGPNPGYGASAVNLAALRTDINRLSA